MDREILVQVFDHILEGWDIATPAGMLRVKAENAAVKHPDLPYSLLTNLAHTVVWQDIWIQKLQGGRKVPGMQEWINTFRVPDINEWQGLRARFLDGLKQAREIAASEPFAHEAGSDEIAVETLIRIAVHASYHCGQMNLLKRIK
jgi:uncharacterized damage-inducible protein DinB